MNTYTSLRSAPAVAVLWFLIIASLPATVSAHIPEDSYLFLRDDQGALELTWDISAGNLNEILSFEIEADQEIDAVAVMAAKDAVLDVARENLTVSQAAGECTLKESGYKTINYTSGIYASIEFLVKCPSDTPINFEYTLLEGIESGHRGILLYNWVEGNASRFEFFEGKSSFTLESAADSGSVTAPDSVASKPTSWASTFITYIKEGIWHIWIGLDHILFIVTLLLPAVLIWRDRQWQATTGFKPVLIETVKIVTAFTVAHSITLTMSTLGWVSLPAKITESIIALSVLVVAINNIRPFFPRGRWTLAFLFGLLHGFGFAYVLGDLGLHSSGLLLSLAGFNIGVEIGQLAIVLLLMPLLYWCRESLLYRKVLMPLCSALIGLIALLWIIERVSGKELLGL